MKPGTSLQRQEWLEAATEALRGKFAAVGATVPANVRVGFGWPRGGHGKGRAIGQCWGPTLSTDGHNELFISPELGVPASASPDTKLALSCRIADVLAHELVHATVGTEAGHKGPFKQLAEKIGLTGKMTATVAGPEFDKWADDLIGNIGFFPSGGLNDAGRKKQSTRLLKCECGQCGYTARVTAKWINEIGPPVCPADEEPMEVAA